MSVALYLLKVVLQLMLADNAVDDLVSYGIIFHSIVCVCVRVRVFVCVSEMLQSMFLDESTALLSFLLPKRLFSSLLSLSVSVCMYGPCLLFLYTQSQCPCSCRSSHLVESKFENEKQHDVSRQNGQQQGTRLVGLRIRPE